VTFYLAVSAGLLVLFPIVRVNNDVLRGEGPDESGPLGVGNVLLEIQFTSG